MNILPVQRIKQGKKLLILTVFLFKCANESWESIRGGGGGGRRALVYLHTIYTSKSKRSFFFLQTPWREKAPHLRFMYKAGGWWSGCCSSASGLQSSVGARVKCTATTFPYFRLPSAFSTPTLPALSTLLPGTAQFQFGLDALLGIEVMQTLSPAQLFGSTDAAVCPGKGCTSICCAPEREKSPSSIWQ